MSAQLSTSETLGSVKPPLLLLCHRIPYPPNKGDKIRSFNLLKHLATQFTVSLGAFVDDPEDLQFVNEVEKYASAVKLVVISPFKSKIYSSQGFLTGQALSIPYYANSEMQQWVGQTVAENRIEHAVIYSSPMAQFLAGEEYDTLHKVIDFVDIDSDKWQQYAQKKSFPMNLVYRREARLLLAYERAIATKFDAGLFVSQQEAALFKTLAPESADKIGYFNNGVDAHYFQPDPEHLNPFEAGEQAIVFTGAMDYWPNVDAVCWFAREVFSQLRRERPKLSFVIVGGKPSSEVIALEQQPGIKVTGRVPDVRPYLQHAIAAVAPMRIARGIQNKVLEAMAMAKAVVVTEMGLEGIGAQNGRHLLVSDDASSMISQVLECANLDTASLGPAAREFVLEEFDWHTNLQKLDKILQLQPKKAVDGS